MAEVHEVREMRPGPIEMRQVSVPVRRTRTGTLLLTFLLGVLCAIAVAIAALSILDIHGTISWPAGRIEVGQNTVPHLLISHPER